MYFDIEKIFEEENCDHSKICTLKNLAKQNEDQISQLVKSTDKLRSKIKTEIQDTDKRVFNNDDKKTSFNFEKKTKLVDISYYLDYLKYSDDVSDLEIFMPQKDDANYVDIISSMLMEIQKEIVLCNKLIDDIPNPLENKEIYEELEKLKYMQTLLFQYNERGSLIEYEKGALNVESPILLYTKTDSGNISFLNDLKKIPVEQYPDILVLFESVINGNFKNPKITFNDNFSSTFTELKKNQIRLTYENITQNYFVLTGVFVKKVMRNSLIRNTLVRIKKIYNANESYLLENLNNSVFIDEQNKITEEVYKILKGGKIR